MKNKKLQKNGAQSRDYIYSDRLAETLRPCTVLHSMNSNEKLLNKIYLC